MDRVGGYAGYKELLEDARAFADVLIVLEAEAEAQRIAALRAKAKGS